MEEENIIKKRRETRKFLVNKERCAWCFHDAPQYPDKHYFCSRDCFGRYWKMIHWCELYKVKFSIDLKYAYLRLVPNWRSGDVNAVPFRERVLQLRQLGMTYEEIANVAVRRRGRRPKYLCTVTEAYDICNGFM